MLGLSATSIIGSTHPPAHAGPLPSPQYGPAWVAECYGLTVDTMRADLRIVAKDAPVTLEMVNAASPDETARDWAVTLTPGGVTAERLTDEGHI